MATNLSIDPDLIELALEVSGERTKKAAITKALQEFARAQILDRFSAVPSLVPDRNVTLMTEGPFPYAAGAALVCTLNS